jgi:hypothetical protein
MMSLCAVTSRLVRTCYYFNMLYTIVGEGVADLLYLNKMSRAAAQAMTDLNAESAVSGQPDNYLDIQNVRRSDFVCLGLI